MERLTEYHAGVAVIKDRSLLPQAMKKLAEIEDEEKHKTVTDILEEVKQQICDDYCKYPTLIDDIEELFVDGGCCTECPLNKL